MLNDLEKYAPNRFGDFDASAVISKVNQHNSLFFSAAFEKTSELFNEKMTCFQTGNLELVDSPVSVNLQCVSDAHLHTEELDRIHSIDITWKNPTLTSSQIPNLFKVEADIAFNESLKSAIKSLVRTETSSLQTNSSTTQNTFTKLVDIVLLAIVKHPDYKQFKVSTTSSITSNPRLIQAVENLKKYLDRLALSVAGSHSGRLTWLQYFKFKRFHSELNEVMKQYKGLAPLHYPNDLFSIPYRDSSQNQGGSVRLLDSSAFKSTFVPLISASLNTQELLAKSSARYLFRLIDWHKSISATDQNQLNSGLFFAQLLIACANSGFLPTATTFQNPGRFNHLRNECSELGISNENILDIAYNCSLCIHKFQLIPSKFRNSYPLVNFITDIFSNQSIRNLTNSAGKFTENYADAVVRHMLRDTITLNQAARISHQAAKQLNRNLPIINASGKNFIMEFSEITKTNAGLCLDYQLREINQENRKYDSGYNLKSKLIISQDTNKVEFTPIFPNSSAPNSDGEMCNEENRAHLEKAVHKAVKSLKKNDPILFSSIFGAKNLDAITDQSIPMDRSFSYVRFASIFAPHVLKMIFPKFQDPTTKNKNGSTILKTVVDTLNPSALTACIDFYISTPLPEGYLESAAMKANEIFDFAGLKQLLAEKVFLSPDDVKSICNNHPEQVLNDREFTSRLDAAQLRYALRSPKFQPSESLRLINQKRNFVF